VLLDETGALSPPYSEKADDISPENMLIGKNVRGESGDVGDVGSVIAFTGSAAIVSATATHANTIIALILLTLMIPTQIFQLFVK
jgi:hypothetical protein